MNNGQVAALGILDFGTYRSFGAREHSPYLPLGDIWLYDPSNENLQSEAPFYLVVDPETRERKFLLLPIEMGRKGRQDRTEEVRLLAIGDEPDKFLIRLGAGDVIPYDYARTFREKNAHEDMDYSVAHGLVSVRKYQAGTQNFGVFPMLNMELRDEDMGQGYTELPPYLFEARPKADSPILTNHLIVPQHIINREGRIVHVWVAGDNPGNVLYQTFGVEPYMKEPLPTL